MKIKRFDKMNENEHESEFEDFVRNNINQHTGWKEEKDKFYWKMLFYSREKIFMDISRAIDEIDRNNKLSESEKNDMINYIKEGTIKFTNLYKRNGGY